MGSTSRASNFALIVFASILMFVTPIKSFNITRLLNNHPDFSNFNDLLTETGVANPINKRQTITVLVVDNSAMGGITSKSKSTIRYILANHVILDYYDELKLGDLAKKKSGTIVTTLLQTTGIAEGKQGFLNITTTRDGDVNFGSAVKGADHNSKMVKVVAAQPGNISVVQISQPIITPGLATGSPLPPSSSPLPDEGEAAAPPPKRGKKSRDDDYKDSKDDDDSSDDAASPDDDSGDDSSGDHEDKSESPSGKKGKDEKGGDDDEPKNKNGGVKVAVGVGAMVGVLVGLLGLSSLLQ